jgi:membrane protease YdiL (CAAX protease family)
VSVAIIAALYLATVWLLVVREGALSWQTMGWPASWSAAPAALGRFAYGAGLAAPTVLVTIVLGTVLALLLGVAEPSLLPVPTTPAEWVADILVAVVLAPVGEELFFRGFAQTAWTLDLGWRRALVRTALFFAIVHALNVSAADFSQAVRLLVAVAIARLPVAFILGWVFARTGSIAAPLGLHATFNGLSLVLFALLQSAASPG